MPKTTDMFPVDAAVYFLPVETRVPLKFGNETLTSVILARASVSVSNSRGSTATGWGETPLSVQWAWPSPTPFATRQRAMMDFTLAIARELPQMEDSGHALEVGYAFIQGQLHALLERFNQGREPSDRMPWLAALICCSAFDLALHDAYGILNQLPVYQTYSPPFLNRDLSWYLAPAEGSEVSFARKYPADFLQPRRDQLPAWHLVGGKDPVDPSELTGAEPKDGYPVLLEDWIRRDGLTCLKIKLTGINPEWDVDRLVKVGRLAMARDVRWLSADFNCTVTDPAYVTTILDRLLWDHPAIFARLLYVEQPFPYELEENMIDVHSVSARKPLFMDESAHDWGLVRLGRKLGWSGVALKTCKTQTGALLSLCWAKAHGMTLMVQDLTNPMLAQIPHLLLAAHAGTIMGVETNGMQFYPEASLPEAAIHPGLYARRNGAVDLSSIQGHGFGYRLGEITRRLPDPATL